MPVGKSISISGGMENVGGESSRFNGGEGGIESGGSLRGGVRSS